MNIFQILNNLYTQTNAKWMRELSDTDVEPYILNRWIAMNDNARSHASWLDKYVFTLPPKMFVSLAWSVLPKMQKAPFVKYIKQIEDDEEYNFIYARIRRQFEISDNDFAVIKPMLYNAIKTDMVKWFSYYGIPKTYWKKYLLDYTLMKNFNREEAKRPTQGLGAWGF